MITFDNISKSYQLGSQQVQALRGINGQIQQGKMIALCGPSGSGKSTLLSILGLLDMHYQGQVSLNGQTYPCDPIKAAKLRRNQFGFVFQRFNLVPVMTALENVAYPLHLTGYDREEQKKRATQILSRVGLEDFIHHRPDNLSGGQQQRVAIARALVHQPQLVIADEPTASLDSETATLVIDLMKELGKEIGSTFIVATHDHRMARHCDNSINLLDGMINKEQMQWAS
ncbi:lipoprotein-releasing system ATP-binding protein LolD [Psychromonas sp. psych-6C06]|uniref:ABC transporter ATP-binding protein n=1 Tax=Psychromonas sp. psych-6C06 TaxID=2058089 RepID=UPI000C32B55A|nr:ABC transporter ATP-binding protein [Psychromonas sp. psych-6C06]PKF63749.1 lipoprotein-releasing system ATP-binding protein LolD [Psychromonas sp. psych-6C06]